MYDCPNCGGNLRFDISLQKLHCDYCGTDLDPYSYEKKKDAVESQVFETTVYTCPQCGGEIMTTNVSATGFCTYCGASTILDSRIRNEKRPARIIPFQKTKEDCKKSFASMMRRSLYAPKELKSSEYLENFRGIYIPYWMYDFKINQIKGMRGSTSARHGDYIVTKHYSLNCDMDTSYNGVSFDASSSLDDSLSESIAPFDANGAKDFTPSFLCGFYADTADVPANTYKGDALSLIAEDVVDRAKSQIFPGRGAVTPADPERVLRYSSSKPACAMFPVWFLTYRHKDRVAYAVMNGQTGKISSDLPIVEGKYLAGSLIFAVPLFFLFNAVLTVTAPTALLLTMIPAAAAGFAFLSEIRAQIALEAHEGDKGYQTVVRIAPEASVQETAQVTVQETGQETDQDSVFKTAQEATQEPVQDSVQETARETTQESVQDSVQDSAQETTQESVLDSVQKTAQESAQDTAQDTAQETIQEAGPEDKTTKNSVKNPENDSENNPAGKSTKKTTKSSAKGSVKKNVKKEKKKKGGKSSLTFAILAICYFSYFIFGSIDSFTDVVRLALTIVPVLLGIWLTIQSIQLHREHGAAKAGVFPGIGGAILALAVVELVTIFHPVSDLYYYGAGIASILLTGFTLIAVVRRYNLMATRPLPSFFDRKGGDVRG
ncbi:Double zinc ribbon [Sarcina sp. DSM 11001]|uniref:zinc ribbon domain-containing protein n=1 Tax=Sarcina sp. DSM 11001 TaxID=1798184 RepID=UPI0008852BAE|nr:zinc ribbon domain-containing protein [Sarcina sp. DSM 11001]SDK82546.1 Double zinc ribbon [Sarcina sp. DSM 11001]